MASRMKDLSLNDQYQSAKASARPRGAHKDEGLTSDELKVKLMQVVKNKGIYDLMKSQLRNKLVHELNPNLNQIKAKSAEHAVNQKLKSNLAMNTINSLLIDHLKTNGYDYTLSVFMPECGININEAYSLSDVLHILKISSESKLYNELNNQAVIRSKGLLWYLVSYFCSHYVTHETSTQTDLDPLNEIVTNLDQKLRNLDKHYLDVSENFAGKLTFEEKIVAYQKRLDDKSKLELHQKLAEFKEIELARMRVEEREKLRLELQSYRNDLENTYKARNQALNQKEKSFEEFMKQKREMDEREMFLQRQHLLDEIKQLREKEAEFKRSIESQSKYLRVDSDKYEKIEQDFKSRELKLKLAEDGFESRLRDERERIKIDLEKTYGQREFILQSIEAKNKQDSTHIEIERAHLDRLKHDYQEQQMKFSDINLQLQKALGENICLKQENDSMRDRLSNIVDYELLKQENKELKQKLDVSKQIIGEKSLERSARGDYTGGYPSARYIPQRKRSVTFVPPLKLKNPNDETSQMQDTVIGADPLPIDHAGNLNAQEIDFDDEKSRATYEGDKIINEYMSEQNDNIRNQNLMNDELKDLFEMQIYEQRKLQDTINDVKKNVEFLFNGVYSDEISKPKKQFSSGESGEILDTSLGFIDSAKNRLKYLDSEGEKIENAFRDYQHKIKSKYYPINDDEDNEIRIVNTKKKNFNPLDVEKFLESTIKANLKAKAMREELEQEISKGMKKENSLSSVPKLADFKEIDDLIRSAPIISSDRNHYTENNSIRDSILKEETELKLFQSKFHGSDPISSNKFNLKSISKRDDDDDDDTTTFTNRNPKPYRNSFVEEEKTLESESKAASDIFNQKKTSLDDYKKIFDEKPKLDKNNKSIESRSPSPPPQRGRIKIEYSSSSSTGSGSSSDNDDKISLPDRKQSAANVDEDDDFY